MGFYTRDQPRATLGTQSAGKCPCVDVTSTEALREEAVFEAAGSVVSRPLVKSSVLSGSTKYQTIDFNATRVARRRL